MYKKRTKRCILFNSSGVCCVPVRVILLSYLTNLQILLRSSIIKAGKYITSFRCRWEVLGRYDFNVVLHNVVFTINAQGG